MKKIIFYILIFITITGGLFGAFGGVNEEGENSILGVDRVYAEQVRLCQNTGDDFGGSYYYHVRKEERCNPSDVDHGLFGEEKAEEIEEIADVAGLAEKARSPLEIYGIKCSLFRGFDIGECFAVASWYVYSPSSIVLKGASLIFNKMLYFSISKEIIDQDFVKTTWGATRGFANMLFILVLVAVSLSIILDIGQLKSKELILNVIIIALFVNFSLFAARVVIDAGNITAIGFYNSIRTSNDNMPNELTQDSGTKDVSGFLVSAFNPAKLVDKVSFEKWRRDSDSASAHLAVVFLMAAGINLYTAFIFFMAGFLFVVRVAWLWILMSLAPLAFLSFVIPQLKGHWDKWWKRLFDNAFCITVFMFLIWLTLIIVKSQFVSGITTRAESSTAGSLVDFLVIIAMQYMIVIILLRASLSETKKLCSDGGIGDKVFGMAKGAVGLAGFASGGALLGAGAKALAGQGMRRAIGGTAQWGAGKAEKWGGGRFAASAPGKLALKTLRNVGDAKFGMKEGYKTRQGSLEKEHHTYAASLSDKKTIKTAGGETISPQDQYYKNLQKGTLGEAAVHTAAGVAAVASGGLLAPVSASVSEYVRSSRSAGSKAVENKKKTSDLVKKIEDLRTEDLKEARILLQAAKDDLEKAKKSGTQPETAIENYRTGVSEAQEELDKVNRDIKKEEGKLKEAKEKMKVSKKK